jgi:ABC-type nitrate/sulfonate/bicarbonate transport system permease component
MTIFIFFVFAIQVAALKRHPLVELARSIGTSWIRTSAFVIWPLSRPLLGACFRLAAPAALVGTIVAEFVASSSGLGHVLLSALGSLNSELAFACIFLIATIGGLLQGLGALIEGPRMGLNN